MEEVSTNLNKYEYLKSMEFPIVPGDIDRLDKMINRYENKENDRLKNLENVREYLKNKTFISFDDIKKLDEMINNYYINDKIVIVPLKEIDKLEYIKEYLKNKIQVKSLEYVDNVKEYLKYMRNQ